MTQQAGKATEIDPALAWASLALVLSGVIHVPVWWWSGDAWEGAVSWRKPILFGISGGVTLWSLAWVWSLLPRHRLDSVIRPVLLVSLVIEVGIITMQIWRNEPSHFNRSTWLNARLDEWTLILITLVVMIIIWLAIRSLGGLATDPVTALSVRAGMGFLVISCALGYATSILGYGQLEAGMRSDLWGKAGVLKFPHGACLHALQTLPLLAWVRGAMGVPASTTAMACWVGAHALYLVYALWQTGNGLGRAEVDEIGLSLLALAASLATFAWFPTRADVATLRVQN